MILSIPRNVNVDYVNSIFRLLCLNRKPQFSSNAHMTSVNELYQYCHV